MKKKITFLHEKKKKTKEKKNGKRNGKIHTNSKANYINLKNKSSEYVNFMDGKNNVHIRLKTENTNRSTVNKSA